MNGGKPDGRLNGKVPWIGGSVIGAVVSGLAVGIVLPAISGESRARAETRIEQVQEKNRDQDEAINELRQQYVTGLGEINRSLIAISERLARIEASRGG